MELGASYLNTHEVDASFFPENFATEAEALAVLEWLNA